MRVVTGTDTGLLKVVDVVKGEVNITIGEQKKGRGVRKIQWANPNNDSEVAALYDDGSIDFYWMATGQRRFSVQSSLKNIQGFHCETISDDTRNIYVCDNEGMLNIYHFPISKYNIVQPSDDFLRNLNSSSTENHGEGDEAHYSDDESNNGQTKSQLNPSLGYKVTEDVQTHKIVIEPQITELKLTGGDVSVMVAQRLDSKRLEVAVAGNNNLMKIWDVETQKCVFKAKNVPHDHLNMKQPIWDNGICYLGSGHGSEDERNQQLGEHSFGNLICTRTAYHQVRYFDRRAQERPIHQYTFEDHNFTAMAPSSQNIWEVVVGTAIGKMFKYNFTERSNKKIHVYRKIAGSVRDIKFHPNKKLICCVSADRYLRVYEQETRELLHSTYLMQRLNCLLLTNDRYVSKDDNDDEGAGSDDEESMFGMNMKQVRYEQDHVLDDDDDEETTRVPEAKKQPSKSHETNLASKKRKQITTSETNDDDSGAVGKKASNNKKHVDKLQELKNRIKKSKLK
ncbi:hypothetical protein C9374_006614 [Naegleria lovaniensis]|uniref:Uncharacterized protein n=1 Tax=Naegleria lovaniensis TaxID=51637 RepID=A0AA88KGU9_NAELO|nr:uncharacterized protein C9374_006614 [Naegleria lovaniensis]KAG2379497.1 hypothetical protein C9374_006614 [Naegleria lovaniensis]